jgi:hypothetical protein
VEIMSRTNPLVPEDLTDTDRDGASNADEVTGHTDPLSNDGEFRSDRGYVVQVSDADPDAPTDAPATTCARPTCRSVATQARPDPLGNIIPAGTNDIILYFQSVGPTTRTGSASPRPSSSAFSSPAGHQGPAGHHRARPADWVVGR